MTKTVAFDATYKPHLKNKRHDPHDRPLNPGGAYFTHFDETEEYEQTFVGVEDVSNTRVHQSHTPNRLSRSRPDPVPEWTACIELREGGIRSTREWWQVCAHDTVVSLHEAL